MRVADWWGPVVRFKERGRRRKHNVLTGVEVMVVLRDGRNGSGG